VRAQALRWAEPGEDQADVEALGALAAQAAAAAMVRTVSGGGGCIGIEEEAWGSPGEAALLMGAAAGAGADGGSASRHSHSGPQQRRSPSPSPPPARPLSVVAGSGGGAAGGAPAVVTAASPSRPDSASPSRAGQQLVQLVMSLSPQQVSALARSQQWGSDLRTLQESVDVQWRNTGGSSSAFPFGGHSREASGGGWLSREESRELPAMAEEGGERPAPVRSSIVRRASVAAHAHAHTTHAHRQYMRAQAPPPLTRPRPY
jgi:hypothetical protein